MPKLLRDSARSIVTVSTVCACAAACAVPLSPVAMASSPWKCEEGAIAAGFQLRAPAARALPLPVFHTPDA
eukprot:scaffold113154_cov35-Tisochrysis_lutea.AAC.1